MRYINEYRDKELMEILLSALKKEATGNYYFMEVCGSHTHAIRRFGIPSLLPVNIKLLSGPGCPVCVTGQDYINRSIALASMEDTIIVTYGDLLPVPGNDRSLNEMREEGADIRVVYSCLDALIIASENSNKQVIFLAIGFETTAPSTAVTVLNARNQGLKNFYILSGHKIMPPVMEALIEDGISINGYICPGHVSTITGSRIYQSLAEKYKVAAVVSGFEPVDILQSILMLVRQVNNRNYKAEIQYKRAVSPGGNDRAQRIMNSVFDKKDDIWRGIGMISGSGLRLKKEFSDYDADKQFDIIIDNPRDNSACICGEVLKGLKTPLECSLFRNVCRPDNPKGACMVSSEGSCNAYYKYGK